MPARPPFAKAVEIEINHRRSVECERLTKDEAADDRCAEWPSQLCTHAGRSSKQPDIMPCMIMSDNFARLEAGELVSQPDNHPKEGTGESS